MKLIDADALYEFMREKTEDGSPAEQMMADLKNEHLRIMLDRFATVDAVEVVRCEQCWHRFTGHFGMMCIGRPNDFFCANGERRKDDEAD